MTEAQARAHYNFLMTLCIRREEAFGPLAAAFIKDHDLDALGLTAEEQLNLFIATAEAFPPEPRRHPQKLQYLRRAQKVMGRISKPNPDLARHLAETIAKTSAELEIYRSAFQQPINADPAASPARPTVVVETDLPDYFLATAQQHAADYYRAKYAVSDETRIGLSFKGPTRRFQPENPAVHKDIAGACMPFMNARLSAFHLMLPFDIQISRRPDTPLDAGMRIWYVERGYSFPLSYQQGRFCSWYDGEVVDLAAGDPHLRYVSVSAIKEPELGTVQRPLPTDLPLELGLPISFLNGADALGPYIQFGCNFKVWFDAREVSLLTQGAPDLHEYGVVGGAGLITHSYASEGVSAYAAARLEPWQDGLSFNYVNIHLHLIEGVETAFVPFNTPLFSVYFLHDRSHVAIQDRRTIGLR